MLKGVLWVATVVAAALGAAMVCAVAVQIAIDDEEMRLSGLSPAEWNFDH